MPSDIQVTKTRDYGFTANEKSTELIDHMLIATLAVVILMGFALGRREAVVVAVAVPVTLALTIAASLPLRLHPEPGDPVRPDLLHRHPGGRRHRGGGEHRPPLRAALGDPRLATVYAVDEVGNPTILATFTVIAALLPLAFVSGLMGPYMRPIPINASAAMLFSLLVAFVISPWLTYRLFRKKAEAELGHPGGGPDQETPGGGEAGGRSTPG